MRAAWAGQEWKHQGRTFQVTRPPQEVAVKRVAFVFSLVFGLMAAPASALQLPGATELIAPQVWINLDGVATPAATVEEGLAALGLGTGATARAAGENGDSAGCPVLGKQERYLFRKINRARERRNVRRVGLDVQISAVAGTHSRAMKRQARLYHTGDRRLSERVTRWIVLGENVGRGQDADSLHRAFMESRPHRRLVTDREFRHVGIGITRDQYQTWVTVLFESRLDPGTTMRLPEGC